MSIPSQFTPCEWVPNKATLKSRTYTKAEEAFLSAFRNRKAIAPLASHCIAAVGSLFYFLWTVTHSVQTTTAASKVEVIRSYTSRDQKMAALFTLVLVITGIVHAYLYFRKDPDPLKPLEELAKALPGPNGITIFQSTGTQDFHVFFNGQRFKADSTRNAEITLTSITDSQKNPNGTRMNSNTNYDKMD